jgi:serine kinase of HPr protein (carbohydrate metabolism regulator)
VSARQATCVAIGGRALLIEGAPGCGKSSLALALIDRGAVLVGDDSLWLEAKGGELLASPHPNTRGLIEVRGLGLVEMPVAERVPVALLLRLEDGAPRYVEAAGSETILGVGIPALALWPDSPVLHLRAELALEKYGLR